MIIQKNKRTLGMAVPKGPIQKYTHLDNNMDRGRNQWIKKNFEIFFFEIVPVLESRKGLPDNFSSGLTTRMICGPCGTC